MPPLAAAVCVARACVCRAAAAGRVRVCTGGFLEGVGFVRLSPEEMRAFHDLATSIFHERSSFS